MPILDGSAKLFIEKLKNVGLSISNSPIKIIKINKKIEFKDGKRFITIEPSKLSLDIEFELKYTNKIIGNQKNKINVYEDDLTDILTLGHFAYLRILKKLKKMVWLKAEV